MKYCWNDNRNKVINALTNILALLVASVTTLHFIYHVYLQLTSWTWSCLPSVAISCVILYFCGRFLLIIAAHERKYRVDEQGLTIGYPFGIRKFYAWSDIGSMAICKVHYIKKGPIRYKTAIRFVIGLEKVGPEQAKSADERWSEEMYEIKHWEKIITIEFSEDRLNEITSVSEIRISDYRHLPDPSKYY